VVPSFLFKKKPKKKVLSKSKPSVPKPFSIIFESLVV
jgi:hypothetical protein